MLTISEKTNVKLNKRKVTVFVVRKDGLYICRCVATGYNATDEQCLNAYFEQDVGL